MSNQQQKTPTLYDVVRATVAQTVGTMPGEYGERTIDVAAREVTNALLKTALYDAIIETAVDAKHRADQNTRATAERCYNDISTAIQMVSRGGVLPRSQRAESQGGKQ